MGLISIRADDNKNITSYDYDSLGRVLKTTVEDSADKTDGKLTTTTWRDALGNVTQLVDPFGLKTQSRYDEAGLIEFSRTEQAEVYADGQTHRGVFFKTQFGYNTAGLIEKRTHSAAGDTLQTVFYGDGTTFEYDNLGRLTKQTQQLSSQQDAATEFQYDVFGVRKWLKDANKNETTFVLDNLGRTTQENTGLGTRSYDYDSFGNLLQSTDRNGKTIQFSYDNLGRRTREQWLGDGADGYVADFMFTQLGELAEAKNSEAGNVISEYDYDYDIARRLATATQQLRPLEGAVVDFVYEHDLIGRVTAVTADLPGTAGDYKNTYAYDNVGRPTRVGQEPLIRVDDDGNPVSGNTVEPKTITLEHNYSNYTESGAPIIQSYIRRYESNGTGTPVASTKQNSFIGGGASMIHHYQGDIPGGASSNAVVTGTIQQQWQHYDPRGLVVKKATSKKVSGKTETTTIENFYDNFGQLRKVTTDLPGTAENPPPQTFAYDENGNPLDGTMIGSYNRLLENANKLFEYDPEGNVQRRWAFGTPVTGTIRHGEQLWTAAHTWQDETYRLVFTKLLFEPNSQLDTNQIYTLEGDVYFDHFPDTYVNTIENITITYDAALGKWAAAVPATFWFDAGNGGTSELFVDFRSTTGDISPPDVAQGSEFVVAEPTIVDHFTWDHRNRLIEFRSVRFRDNVTLLTKAFTYDVHDRLIASEATKSGASEPVKEVFVWERDQRVVDFRYDGSSYEVVRQRLYAPGVDQLLAAQVPHQDAGPGEDVVLWPLPDHQGSPMAVYFQGTVEEVRYTPFGRPTFGDPAQPSWMPITTPVQELIVFNAGREFDFDIGLYYNRARWYDPASGRFISQDPIGFAGGDTNLYRYAFNSPDNATDPSGNFVFTALAVGGLIGLNYFVWGNNFAAFDDIANDRPIDAAHTPYSLENGFEVNTGYVKGAAFSTAAGAGIGLAVPVAAAALPGWAFTTGVVGFAGYGIYAEGGAAIDQFQQGNYFSGGFHTFGAALSAYGGYKVRGMFGGRGQPPPRGVVVESEGAFGTSVITASPPAASSVTYAGAGISTAGAITSLPVIASSSFLSVPRSVVAVEGRAAARITDPGRLLPAPAANVLSSEGGKIVAFAQPRGQYYWRVFSGNSTTGGWLTATRPRSAAWARESLSLPPGNNADFIQRVFVPGGARSQRSRAKAVVEWGRLRGGGEQFQLLEHLPVTSFGSGVPFK